jgi:uncharacterized delta-60 repeat protein
MRSPLLFTALSCIIGGTQAQSLDPTFGTGGTQQYDLSGSDRLFGVAVRPDGKIVACGLRDSVGIAHFMVCRFDPDGTLDPTFGSGGYVTLPTGVNGSEASRIILLPDGRMVVAGRTFGTMDRAFIVRRLLPDGDVDASFGVNGVWMDPIGANGAYITDMALDAQGRVVVAGVAIATNLFATLAVVRLGTNGLPDPTFANNGHYRLDESEQVRFHFLNDLQLLADGRMLIAGNVGDMTTGSTWNTDVLCIRLLANGQYDPTFGNNGVVVTDVQGLNDGAERIRLLANNELELIGTSGNNSQGNWVCRQRLSATGSVISTDLVPVNAWTPTTETKQIADILSMPDGGVSYIGMVPNGGTSDGFVGMLDATGMAGLPYVAGYSTTVDAGDWTSFAGGVFDANGRLLLVGLTTNPEWIGHFPDQCGVFTDIFLARFNMPFTTHVAAAEGQEVRVWPVPATDRLHVNSDLPVLRMQLIDHAGRTVWESLPRQSTDQMTMDVDAMPAGTYQLRVETSGSVTVHKVMVQH